MNLLELARGFLESRLLGKEFSLPEEVKEEFKESKGMFIILRKNKRLRGSAYLLKTYWPIWRTTMELMLIAALRDPGHKAIKADEVNDIEIEIYLMNEPQIVEYKGRDLRSQIEIGKEGLILDCEGKTEALLPETVKECALPEDEFMDCICKKMGFRPSTWKESGCEIWKFEVEKLSE